MDGVSSIQKSLDGHERNIDAVKKSPKWIERIRKFFSRKDKKKKIDKTPNEEQAVFKRSLVLAEVHENNSEHREDFNKKKMEQLHSKPEYNEHFWKSFCQQPSRAKPSEASSEEYKFNMGVCGTSRGSAMNDEYVVKN